MKQVAATSHTPRGQDRRTSTLHALWSGSFRKRRRHARRDADVRIAAIDWHHPQWLAVAMLILLLCCVDAVLTLTLVGAGGSEINPFMRPLVGGDAAAFTYWKFGLTAGGVMLLVVLARARVFGRVSVGPILYGVLAAYVALVAYELWLVSARMGITSLALLFAA